jgi:hypothetical protein
MSELHAENGAEKEHVAASEKAPLRGEVVIAKIGKLLAATAPEDLEAVKSYAHSRWFAGQTH